MAVKNITNPHAISKENVNRGKQTSNRNLVNRQGNRQTVVIPGLDFTKNYSITLKNVDTSILNYVKNVMTIFVSEAGERIKVPVLYGNEERWKAVRKNGILRDKNGSLIFPLIVLRRTDISKNDTVIQSFKHDVKNNFINVERASKWSKTNRYDRFAVQTNKDPVIETLVTSMPDFTNITYEVIVWTNFIEQMNKIIETFVSQSNKYWGDTTDYKFLCNIESISDASEMSQDGERFVKSTFSILTNAYLLPEEINSTVTGKISQLRKKNSMSQVVFGFEGSATDFQVKK